MRLGVLADVHGNDVALRAVLQDADRFGVDRWWALGDLALFGPRPADAAGRTDLVERYAAMAAGIGWTRGVLDQAGLLDVLAGLPAQLHLRLPGGARVLGVHASPRADDGPGIGPGTADEQLGRLLAGCDADVVIGGHTHHVADRRVGGIRALNPGSAGLPRTSGMASWLLLEDDGEDLAVTQRGVPFDAGAVVADLRRRRHPNADFMASVLTGRHQMLPGCRLGLSR